MTGVAGLRAFVAWGRPAAPLLALAVYGAYWLVRPSEQVERIMLVLALSVVAGLAYGVLARRLGDARVLRIALPLDTALIAAMTAALERPAVLALAYFWSIALAAFFLGRRDTIANTAVASVFAAAVPYLVSASVDEVVVVTDVLVLWLIGGLLAVLSGQAADARERMRREAEEEAAVARIAQRLSSTFAIDELLPAIAEEIGRSAGAARGLIRLTAPADRLYRWEREGVPPLEIPAAPPSVRRVAETGRPLVVPDRAGVTDPELAGYMDAFGTQALAAWPIAIGGRVVAVIGFHHDRPRAWDEVATLVGRVIPQVAAALAQAEAFAQQERSLEELRHLTHLRENLIANVSHELRTPLTSTLGFLQTLERPDLDLADEQRRQFLALARSEAQRLARLVTDLLAYATVDRGAIELRRERVEVEPAVRRAAAAHPSLDGRLVLDVEAGLTVDADPDRLLQVLSNLIANALEHGEGSVTVTGAAVGKLATIAVADEGPGVPAEHAGELFVPFARWSERSDSTGLGLAIARGIAHAHGGRLVYEPGAEDRRHAFVLTLPLG